MAAIEKREGRNKPYRVRYWTPGGEQRSRSFARRGEAEKFAAVMESDKARGAWIDPRLSKVTLNDWSQKWLATAGDLKPKTRDGYESLLRVHILPVFGTMPLGEIEPMAVREWVAKLREGGLSPSRVRQSYRVLSGCLKAAVEAEYIGRSPCLGVKLPRMIPREMKFLSARQVAQLADVMPERYRVLVFVLAYGGLRWGEAAALRRRRCDLLRGRFEVAESLAEVNGKRYFGDTKTHQRRFVVLPTFLREMLESHLEEFSGTGPDDFVFSAVKGGAIRHRDFWEDVWRPSVKRAKLPEDLRIHDLRHTCAALLISEGAHPKMIQNHLGHASITVTFDRYGHLFPDDLERLAASLDASFRRGQTAPGNVVALDRGVEPAADESDSPEPSRPAGDA